VKVIAHLKLAQNDNGHELRIEVGIAGFYLGAHTTEEPQLPQESFNVIHQSRPAS